MLAHVEQLLGVDLDRRSVVRKRRTVGVRTVRDTWIRIQPTVPGTVSELQGGGTAASAGLDPGIAKPGWYGGVRWTDLGTGFLWRADETELITESPVRSAGTLASDHLTREWWTSLDTSLDRLARSQPCRARPGCRATNRSPSNSLRDNVGRLFTEGGSGPRRRHRQRDRWLHRQFGLEAVEPERSVVALRVVLAASIQQPAPRRQGSFGVQFPCAGFLAHLESLRRIHRVAVDHQPMLVGVAADEFDLKAHHHSVP